MREVFAIAACAAVVTAGCSSTSEGTGGGTDGSATPKAAGTYIEIPECSSPDASSLRINNRGLYVKCGSSNASTVHRLELGGPSPRWYAHKPGFTITGFEPTKRETEKSDEFSIFWFNLQKHGYFSMNSDSPASEAVNPNTNVSSIRHMLVDNSPSANKWAVTYGGPGWAYFRVSPRSTGGAVTFEEVIKAPGPGGEHVEADTSDAFIWAGLGTKLTKIGIDKSVETTDLAPSTQETSSRAISKIRVKSGYAWVQSGNSVFRGKSPDSMEVFATIRGQAVAVTAGGSFAVDGSFVYLTDGRKISIDGNTETTFFSTTITPSAGTSVDQIMMQSEFQGSRNLEVSSDPLDPYVYMVSTSRGARILRVAK